MDNTTDQQSKFNTKKGVEVNNDTRGNYYVNSQIRFRTTMLKSSLNAEIKNSYIFVIETVTVTGDGTDTVAQRANKRNK